MGTAYAVWTGIPFFGEAATLARFFFVALITVGIVVL